MTNPTSNFGWQMPTSTDLVTDLPADFETFGQAVDTSMADLKGGTTGQILSKTTNTDMDFTWITNDVGDITAVTAGTGISGGGTSGAVTITNSMATAIDAKGDLVAGTGADAFSRLAVGANGTVLTADSTAATGLAYEGAWTDYTPTVVGPVLGNGTQIARYRKIGKFVTVFYSFTLGSTSSVGSLNYFSLPFNQAYAIDFCVPAGIRDSGIAVYAAGGETNSNNIIWNYSSVAVGTSPYYLRCTATTPMTWTTNDVFRITYTYEAA